MKKYEHLGKSLSREEQKSIGGGLTQVANTVCTCVGGEIVAACGSTCNDVYAVCNTECGGSVLVASYGTCTFAGACW